MRRLLIAMAAIAALAIALDAASSQARAEIDYPYCLAYGGGVEGRCDHTTREQCQASAAGGYCIENFRYHTHPTPGPNGARKRRG
jgi:hypothetical protein